MINIDRGVVVIYSDDMCVVPRRPILLLYVVTYIVMVYGVNENLSFFFPFDVLFINN